MIGVDGGEVLLAAGRHQAGGVVREAGWQARVWREETGAEA